MINLRQITRENIDEVLSLRVNEEQKGFVDTGFRELGMEEMRLKTNCYK